MYYISNDNFEYTDNFVGIDMNDVPDSILSPLRHWHSLKQYDEVKKRFKITNLPLDNEAKVLLNKLRKDYFQLAMKMEEENSLLSVVQRRYENLERLVIVHTCAQNPFEPSPIIQVSNVMWCKDFLEALYQNNKFFISTNVAATPFEHLKSKLLTPIAKAGRQGISHSKLLRDSHIPAKQMADIIKTLVESEQITEVTIKKAKHKFFENLIGEEEWLTSSEAANYLGISCKTLMNLASNGKIPYYKFGRRNRYLKDELRMLLMSQRRGVFCGNNL